MYRHRSTILFVLLLTLSASCAFSQSAEPMLVTPSATDKAIDTFDTPHRVYLNKKAKSRKQLVVFLPGTGGDGRGGRGISQVATDLGYHAVSLSYPSSVPASICQRESDANCFENFRMEIITGEDKSTLLSVNRANSIENRLLKLVMYLKTNHPNDGWENFVTKSGELAWENLVLTGQSQGGGHAPLMAKYHKVARVIMYSSPKDYDVQRGKPAAWYGNGKTPIGRFFSFNHMQDKQGCDYTQQLEILKTLGSYQFGEPVNVDTAGSQFKNSRILVTNNPGKEITSLEAHTMIIGDGRTPMGADGVPVFKPVWIYMLTKD
jgi:hypothetical protein